MQCKHSQMESLFPSHVMFQFNSASPQVSSALKQIQFQRRHPASPLDALYDVHFTMTQRALKITLMADGD